MKKLRIFTEWAASALLTFLALVLLWLLATGLAHAKTKPEPVDIPPVTEEYGEPGWEVCDRGTCQFKATRDGMDYLVATPAKRRTRPTCADKTRFLMTSEDGKKHCIRLEAAK